MPKLIIVDDDFSIRSLLRMVLVKEGFEVLEAGDGQEALEVMEKVKVDLAIIDVMMPRIDGIELCREIKEFYHIPVIMVTAKGETMDKVKGFQTGTDDYIVKPFEPIELVMRVKAIMKRYNIVSAQKLSIGDVDIDMQGRQVKVKGHSIEFPPREYDLFIKLVSSENQIFTRDQLIEEIWGYDFEGDERTIDVHIKRIRERIRDSETVKIVTIRGLGYKAEVLA
ncbi:response regulator transcription factor [Cytobacillus sp. FJAT-54145]|uniref:Heme response regulator HssR n=1 Tax=Cytobacillus spartinae TaxID=3299023 RepID=A0ABW6KGH1_9BACI